MNPESQIIICENFISRADCDFLINGFNKRKPAASLSKDTDNMLSMYELDKIEKQMVGWIVQKILDLARQEFKEELNLIWTGISCRTENNICVLHSDNFKYVCSQCGEDPTFLKNNCKHEKIGQKNHTPEYDYTALLYLSSGHVGGELIMQNGLYGDIYKKEITAEAGKLVLYPNGENFFHETTPIISGQRFCLAIWFSKDEKYINNLKNLI